MVESAGDYYAFGLSQYSRGYNGLDYRYGFNGKEKDENGEFGSQTHLDFGARMYNPSIGRFLSVDGMAGELPGLSPYSNALNNPNVYTDPDGNLPILPFLLKAGAAGAADMLAQAAIAYYFDPDVETVGQAFEKVNWYQVARSSAEGLIPWRTPGGKVGIAAATASGYVLTNALNEGGGYSKEQALQDFAVGFFGDLAGGGIGVLVDKYGAKKVVKALEDLGIDTEGMKNLSKLEMTAIRGGTKHTPLKSDRNLLKGKKHALKMQAGEAQKIADDTGLPLGVYRSKADIEYANLRAAELEPGGFRDFPLPEKSDSEVFVPNGDKNAPQKATHVRVRNNGDGTAHTFPINDTAEPIRGELAKFKSKE